MRSRARARAVVAVLAVAALSVVLAVRAPASGDYAQVGVPNTDAAAPAIDALVAGDLGRFAAEQPSQGPVSLVLRAPFAAAAPASDQASRYRLGAFPCLLVLGLAGLAVAREMRRRERSWTASAVVVALFLLAPPTFSAVNLGHPEEAVATALIVVATLAAGSGAAVVAGIALGLAVATKAWALLLVVPVLLGLRSHVVRGGAAALAAAAVAIAPLAIANPHAFGRAIRFANETQLVHPADIWWQTSRRMLTVFDGVQTRRVHAPHVPDVVRHGIRPLLIALGALIAWAASRRRQMTVDQVFLALAVIMLIRCLLDPGDNRYYHLPFVVFLAAWEGLRHQRLPLIALAAAALTATVPGPIGPHRDLYSWLYLAWSIPLTVALLTELTTNKLKAQPPSRRFERGL